MQGEYEKQEGKSSINLGCHRNCKICMRSSIITHILPLLYGEGRHLSSIYLQNTHICVNYVPFQVSNTCSVLSQARSPSCRVTIGKIGQRNVACTIITFFSFDDLFQRRWSRGQGIRIYLNSCWNMDHEINKASLHMLGL